MNDPGTESKPITSVAIVDGIDDPPPLEIGRHLHIGLATVTWLLGGEVLHPDSLGSQQLMRPGQINLMPTGHGIAHAEEGVAAGVGDDTGGMLGVQMWLARTDAARHVEDPGSSTSPSCPSLTLVRGRPAC